MIPRQGMGRARPAEMAEVAVLVDVTLVLCVVGWVLPYGTILLAAAVVPMAALSLRRRWRALVMAGAVGGGISFVLAGAGLAANVIGCAVVGAVVGIGFRRRWGPIRTSAVGMIAIGPPFAALVTGFLAVFRSLRHLLFKQVRVTWHGIARTLDQFGAHHAVDAGNHAMRWSLGHWWLVIPAALIVGTAGAVFISTLMSVPVLRRLVGAVSPPGEGWLPDEATAGADVAPVPVALRGAAYRYPGQPVDAVHPLSVTLEPGELVAVVGPNGSGKSTLGRLLAGVAPTAGTVQRPGGPGVGQPGGTAVVFQRPECQVLGVRVRDDVVWGLPVGSRPDVEALLARVGLAGMGDRESATLSGGELQRLAVAATLARRPKLLISDESTAMVDAGGRPVLMRLLEGLAHDDGLAVLHISHRDEEARRADRVVAMSDGRFVDRLPPVAWPAPLGRPASRGAGKLLSLRSVGHVYSPHSPWAHRALVGLDLAIGGDEGVLVWGANGSGKSTLAWLISGLLVPTEGEVLLDGRPAARCVGRVGLSFQHARLQLLRRSVRRDVTAAGGVDARGADAALALVGLDPAEVGSRRVDQLSGGQQRRVVLAGLLARKPSVLVLDEPTAGLDGPTRAALWRTLASLRERAGLTLVLVSHDADEALVVVDRVVHLADGQLVDDQPVSALGDLVP